jgi:hypothetical protein
VVHFVLHNSKPQIRSSLTSTNYSYRQWNEGDYLTFVLKCLSPTYHKYKSAHNSTYVGGKFCASVFGRNLALVTVKMFPHLIFFTTAFYKFCTFNAICKDNAAINCTDFNFRFSRRRVWRWMSSGFFTPRSLVDVSRRYRGACCLQHQGALLMEAASTSETSVNFYQTIRRNNPEDSHLQL